MKQVMVLFDFPSLSKVQYDNVWEELRASDHANPKGMLYHVGAEQPSGNLLVTEVWESETAFKEFGKILQPLLEQNDIPLIQPRTLPVYNIYEANEHVSGKIIG
jgi:hypothetical protein